MSAMSGNPKPEGRSPKETRRPKSEKVTGWVWPSSLAGAEAGRLQRSGRFCSRDHEAAACFGIRVSGFFRVSDFGLRVWQSDATDNAPFP
jgi:hypothetical protein